MTKSKRITLLEQRVSELEKALSALFCSEPEGENRESPTLSYEEVIDQWLNGKKQ